MQNDIEKSLYTAKSEIDNILLLCKMAEATIEQGKMENYWGYYPIFGLIKASCEKANKTFEKIDF